MEKSSRLIKIIKDLYKFDRQLLGEGYDKALEYINKIIPLKIYEFPSGTEIGTWKVPQEWVARDAWVKHNGKKIINYQKNPLSLMVYSQPVHGIVHLEELKKHLYVSEELPSQTPYEYSFYQEKWGFCLSQNEIYEELKICTDCKPELKRIDPAVGKVRIDVPSKPILKDKLNEGDYEVFIDTEFKDGVMKVGEHIVKGESDREIFIVVHLDHPWQANDNLSAVAMAIDLAQNIKCKHTIRIVFCPETIGSVAYALTQDLSKVDFMIGAECIGTNTKFYWQKPFNPNSKLNYWTHLAISQRGIDNDKGTFRMLLGGDEYVFNDPKVNIDGILLSRFPYPEYHTSADTPEIINEEKIKEIEKIVIDIISIAERDYVPTRNFKGPLMRSRYGLNVPNKQFNLQLDYFIYQIDGKKSIAEIAAPLGLGFDTVYNLCEQLKKEDLIK